MLVTTMADNAIHILAGPRVTRAHCRSSPGIDPLADCAKWFWDHSSRGPYGPTKVYSQSELDAGVSSARSPSGDSFAYLPAEHYVHTLNFLQATWILFAHTGPIEEIDVIAFQDLDLVAPVVLLICYRTISHVFRVY